MSATGQLRVRCHPRRDRSQPDPVQPAQQDLTYLNHAVHGHEKVPTSTSLNTTAVDLHVDEHDVRSKQASRGLIPHGAPMVP